MLSEASDTYEKVLDIDASNQIAQQELAVLQKKLPVRNAFRMTIEEVGDVESPPKKIVTKSEKLDLPEGSHIPKLVQNIVVDEPTLFDKLAPKEKKPKEKLLLPSGVQSKKNGPLILEIHWEVERIYS